MVGSKEWGEELGVIPHRGVYGREKKRRMIAKRGSGKCELAGEDGEEGENGSLEDEPGRAWLEVEAEVEARDALLDLDSGE